jgi:hypothetical protein
MEKIDRMRIVLFKEGNEWACYDDYTFINLQESFVSFGHTAIEALEQFIAFNK